MAEKIFRQHVLMAKFGAEGLHVWFKTLWGKFGPGVLMVPIYPGDVAAGQVRTFPYRYVTKPELVSLKFEKLDFLSLCDPEEVFVFVAQYLVSKTAEKKGNLGAISWIQIIRKNAIEELPDDIRRELTNVKLQLNAGQGLDMDKCCACNKHRVDLLVCSGCRMARYCNGTCQRNDWKSHKETCAKHAETRTALKKYLTH